MKRTGVFVPVWNDEETLPGILEIVRRSLGGEARIVVVDDASTDGTEKIARSFTPYVVKHKVNLGVGTSTRDGLTLISEMPDIKYVVKMDGDGQHDPEFLPRVIEQLERGSDAVICSRFHFFSDQSHTPPDRFLLNRIFAGLIREITGWEISDARSGFMGFQFRHVKRIAKAIITPRYGIPMELLLRLWRAKPEAVVTEIPHPAIYGGKKLAAKHNGRYRDGGETREEKANRWTEAFNAVIGVLSDLKITTDALAKTRVPALLAG